jgi:hypothetical protein
MKRYLYIVCAMLMGIFSSCSKSEIGGNDADSAGTIVLKVTADEGIQTRSRSVDRYVIEVYTDDTYATAANVFADGTNKVSNATGEFQMVLDRTKEYYCLLWADASAAEVYKVNDLKAVTLQAGQKPAEAWHGTYKIEAGKNATLSTQLKRAVSKLSLLETGTILPNSSLAVAFNQPNVFNVATTAASGTVARTETISLGIGATGTKDAPVKLNDAYIFVLSSAAGSVTDLTFTMSMNGTPEPSFNVTNVPLQTNYNTNVKGHYTSLTSSTFIVTCDDQWIIYDE